MNRAVIQTDCAGIHGEFTGSEKTCPHELGGAALICSSEPHIPHSIMMRNEATLFNCVQTATAALTCCR